MDALYRRVSCCCVVCRRDVLLRTAVCSPPRAGDASSGWKALRDAGRSAGREDTVPLRLLYGRDGRGQVPQDRLSTRVKSGSGSAQVPAPVRVEGGCGGVDDDDDDARLLLSSSSSARVERFGTIRKEDVVSPHLVQTFRRNRRVRVTGCRFRLGRHFSHWSLPATHFEEMCSYGHIAHQHDSLSPAIT